MPALSDSLPAAMGIRTVKSQVSPTSRDSPLSSEPTTSTSGSAASSRSSRDTSPSAASPTKNNPADRYAVSARTRLGTRATGSRAAAPALAFQAAAVIAAGVLVPERGGRADDRAEVAGVGDAVQGDEQRSRAGVQRPGEQVGWIGVGVRRDLER